MWAGFYVHLSLESWKKINFRARKLGKYIIFDENRLVRGFHPGICVNGPCLFILAVVSKAFTNIRIYSNFNTVIFSGKK